MSRQTIAVSVKASKLTARALAYVVAAVGRKIAKEHRKAQTPHGKQSVPIQKENERRYVSFNDYVESAGGRNRYSSENRCDVCCNRTGNCELV